MKIIDSKVWDYGTKLYNLIIINLLWMIFSIPLITIGPATNAGLKSIKELEYNSSHNILKLFIKNFKSNFFAYGLAFNTYIGMLIFFTLFSMNSFNSGNIICTSIGIFALVECIFALGMIFVIKDNNPIDIMINSLLQGNRNALKILITLVISIGILLACISIPILMPISVSMCMFIYCKIIL